MTVGQRLREFDNGIAEIVPCIAGRAVARRMRRGLSTTNCTVNVERMRFVDGDHDMVKVALRHADSFRNRAEDLPSKRVNQDSMYEQSL